jgi:hypothetical protein
MLRKNASAVGAEGQMPSRSAQACAIVTNTQTPRNDADYGQPVLAGVSDVDFNPVRIGVTLARSIADRKRNADRLVELYGFWSRQGSAS